MPHNFIVLLGLFFICLNLFVFFLYGLDKRKAIKNQWRIPEKQLLLYGAVAPLGAFLGMKIFHHKTQKMKFSLLIPSFLFLHIGILIYLFIRFK
jgi:uncharacterized membrane protein YsdA (DUF1294 family)